MKRLIIVFLFLIVSSTTLASESTIPEVSFSKKQFASSEPVLLNYKGLPQPLSIKLQDSYGNSIPYTASVFGDKLQLIPASVWKDGSYSVQVFSEDNLLLNEIFLIGSPKPTDLLQRSAPRVLEPNQSASIILSVPALPSEQNYSLIETVPFDAIISDQSIPQIKTPQLLNLRFPFDGYVENTSEFGIVDPKEHLGLSYHDGVDFATSENTPILAVDDGEIVPYREENNYGMTVAIQHSWGQSFYGHLSKINAEIGTKVRKGEVIGLSGNTGLSTGPHLHFGLKWKNETYIDSLPLLSLENNNKVAQKQLVFDQIKPLSTLTYEMTIPSQQAVVRAFSLDSAVIVDQSSKKIVTEVNKPSYLLSPSLSYAAFAADPFITDKTLMTTRDNVIFWKNETQHVLKSFDLVTHTTYEQPLQTDKENILVIDAKEYKVDVSENSLSLTSILGPLALQQ